MTKINLLPWRDELREQRKKKFVAFCVGVAAYVSIGIEVSKNVKITIQDSNDFLFVFCFVLIMIFGAHPFLFPNLFSSLFLM